MTSYILRFLTLHRLIISLGAVACFALFTMPSAQAGSDSIDAASLAGMQFEQVQTRFRTAGYTWTQEHDNRFSIWVAEKSGMPMYSCQFARIQGREVYNCELINVTLPKAIAFQSIAPADWKSRRAYLLDEATQEGIGYKHSSPLVLMQKRKDGTRLMHKFPLLNQNSAVSYRTHDKDITVAVARGWGNCPVAGSYMVEVLGPNYVRKFSGGTIHEYDVTDPLYFKLNHQSGIIISLQPGRQQAATYNPEMQPFIRVANDLIAAVRSGNWERAGRLFDDKSKADGLANCKRLRKYFVNAKIDNSNIIQTSNGSDKHIGISMTKTWAITIGVDAQQYKIVEMNTEDD